MSSLLEVKDLVIKFGLRTGDVTATTGVSFTLEKGERLGLVGESGAGKSVTGFSIIGLISKPGYVADGKILFNGDDLTKMEREELRHIRGNRISMIFQDPMMTLNPVLSIGTQMIETLLAHNPEMTKKEAKAIALDKLKKVHIPSPEKRLSQYPHEFSGGMRQRIIIAIALLTDPEIIIADEPTTALDVTIQAEIMDLIIELCETDDMGLILITHDLAVVAQVTEHIAVMYAGRVVEKGRTKDVINNPQHPYTQGLIAALPEGAKGSKRLNQIPGMMPTLTNIPPGCAFHPRCPHVMDVCKKYVPALIKVKGMDTEAACVLCSFEKEGVSGE
ncbi:oligopeptide/dipeptide ABC transporter, ATPase subunit [Denitrovibrio acetiphilus DSM 12809]|uniref:Oligopeptide/dipeptide ABC transporter, ATPase subunit n=1 Tax=Denitrovibrio acetiphilus (strain DSM 12809 / NBRC 114555 / N2460) TaxID=522772 RepID=D4H4D6_DENA2|nr:ABC transporter ATP-binding protein [Denitrovibrio acetiphilus]ADD69265.1 oligopeptide/dipeptide ABC transporter, ATPase subunit [Denitrovibrio acetiphilus DSM 12809]